MTELPRMRAGDFPAELLEIFDGYVHGRVSKREFLDRAAKFTVLGLTGTALVEALSPNYARAEQVKADDPLIVASKASYSSPNGQGTVSGLLVKPAGASKKLPGVLVVHENRGLNPYIADVARRVAVAGYVAFAPDGLSPQGGYPGTDDAGREMQAKIEPAKLMEDFFAAYGFLRGHESVSGKVGCVGFCYGGGVCNALAVAMPDLAASVPFYGRQPRAEDVARIRAPLLLHYAELDQGITGGWPAYEAALKAAGKTYAAHVYPGVNHGFHNDTTPRFDEAAAKLAWERTLAFFAEHLG